MRTVLLPLTLPYALALGIKNQAYDQGWLRARQLRRPVISVGNLSVGGAGKTPFVVELARLLEQRGVPVDVLSRGYGRSDPSRVARVTPDGSAARFGDEPLLLARGAPVFVGADRWAAGRLAEQEVETAAHLLDDGFQHRRLARSADIVLFHPTDIPDRLLPAGRLREPVRALRRADFLVVRDGDEQTVAAVQRLGCGKPVWRIRRVLTQPPVEGGVVAFCGIAHPGEFFAALLSHGVELRRRWAFPDHHVFRERDLRAIKESARGASAIFTTEKDWVRLPASARVALADGAPLLPVPLRAELLDADACLAALLRKVGIEEAPGPVRK